LEDEDLINDTAAEDAWAEFEANDVADAAGTARPVALEGNPEDHEDGDGPIVGNVGDDFSDAADDAGDATTTTADGTVWANAPTELRTEFEKMAAENARLLQKERSASGRATGFQRRYEDLLKAAQPRETTGDRPSASAALAAIKEDYPEIATPFEQAINAIEGQVSQLSAAEESRREAAQSDLTEYLDAETNALRSQHNDYLEVLGNNAATLAIWIDDQPRAIRDAFARNAENIVDAAEAATVISLFKAHIGLPANAPAADQSRTTADSLASRRSRQLGATTSLHRTSRRPTVSGIPENADPQDIWDAFEEAERR
jgi:hypothetical protein